LVKKETVSKLGTPPFFAFGGQDRRGRQKAGLTIRRTVCIKTEKDGRTVRQKGGRMNDTML